MNIVYTDNEKKQIKTIMELTVREHRPCGGTGFDSQKRVCSCLKVARWLRMLLEARIPKEYWGLPYTLSLKGVIDEYFRDPENITDGFGFYIFGKYGVGKTTTLAEIGKRFLVQGKRVIYFMLSEFMDTVFSGFHTRKDDEDFMENDLEILSERIKEADVFLIDEFDKAYIKQGSDFVLRETEAFIRTKLMNNYPTFIASNTALKDLSKIFGSESLQAIIGRKLNVEALSGVLDFKNRMKLSAIVKSKTIKSLSESYHKVYVSQFLNKGEL